MKRKLAAVLSALTLMTVGASAVTSASAASLSEYITNAVRIIGIQNIQAAASHSTPVETYQKTIVRTIPISSRV